MRNISDQVSKDDNGDIHIDFDLDELRDGTVAEFPLASSVHPLPLTMQFWKGENGDVQSKIVVITEDGAEEVYPREEDDL